MPCCYTITRALQHIHTDSYLYKVTRNANCRPETTTPALSSGLPYHRVLITPHTHTHKHACTHQKYPTPSVPNCGWHIKGLCPKREVREGLGNHGRQRKRLRDKDQSKIWHFILGRSGRHTPFREEYIATEGRRERRRREGAAESLSSSPSCTFLSANMGKVLYG